MRNTRLFEKSIKNTLSNVASRVEASEQLSYKVKSAIRQQTKKEDSAMKKRFTFKSAMIMAAVLCLTTVTVFAATSGISYISKGSPNARSTTFPTEESLQKNLGFVPKTVETFSNGYTFKDVETGSISAVGKDGKNVGNYKSVDFRYASGQGKKITLAIHKQLPDEKADPKAVKTDYKGFTLSYTSQKYRFVPVGYKLTEEEKKAQQSGEIEFSCGSDTVENSILQNVVWVNNGIDYNLMAADSNLTQADLTAMAKEIVDKSK